MTMRVELQVFSGRPNPTWVLSDTEAADLTTLIKELAPIPGKPRCGLGYHGFKVVADGGPFASLSVDQGIVARRNVNVEMASSFADGGRHIERWLVETATPERCDPDIVRAVIQQVEAPAMTEMAAAETAPPVTTPPALKASSDYDPDRWNKKGVINNNDCYNYATNCMSTDGRMAVPGRKGGTECDWGSCEDIAAAAVRDKLNPRDDESPASARADEWCVALYVTDQNDYHWYRHHAAGFWSHKPSSCPARNCDESGAIITNIRTADTLNYKLCRFFWKPSGLIVK